MEEEQYDKIYRFCYFRVRQRELAEDITQEAFLRFYESGQYKERGKGLHYLYTIARNLCTDQYRRQKTEVLEEEHVRKTDALILSGVCGKTTLYWAKVLAGLSFCAGTAFLFWTLTWALTLGIYGTGGMDAAFQLFYTRSSAPMTYGWALFLGYGCILACALITGIFVMLLSAVFHSSMAALSVTVGLILSAMIVNIPDTYRIPAQIWDWLPFCFPAPWNVFGCYTLTIFGYSFTPWQAVPVLYTLVGLPAVVLGQRIYRRYQITGR